jgi:hypothetical protein
MVVYLFSDFENVPLDGILASASAAKCSYFRNIFAAKRVILVIITKGKV